MNDLSTADAIDCLQRAVQVNPADASCQNNLGNMLKAYGRLEEAVA